MAYSARSSTALMQAAHHDAERVGELCPRSTSSTASRALRRELQRAEGAGAAAIALACSVPFVSSLGFLLGTRELRSDKV